MVARFVNKGLRTRLLFAFVAVLCFGMIVPGSFLFVSSRSQHIKSIQAYMEGQAVILRDLFLPYFASPDGTTSMRNEVSRLKKEINMRITVIDRDGKVLADSDENPDTMENHGQRPEVVGALTQRRGTALRWSHTLGKSMLYVAVPLGSQEAPTGVLRVSMPVNLLATQIREQWPLFFTVIAGVLAVAFIVAYVESGRIATSIESMSEMARQMASGKFYEHSFPRSGTEVDVLGHSLNILASKLGRSIQEFRRTNERLLAVLEASVSGMVIIDDDGRVSRVNKAAEKILGYSRAEIEGIPYPGALRNTDLTTLVEKALYMRETGHREARLLYPNERTVEASAVPLGDGTQNAPQGVVLVLHDLTDLRRLETVRSDFIQNISHELRTPVTVVKGFAETLKDAPPEDPEEVKELAVLIDTEASRLADLVEKLLSLAKIESGHLLPQKTLLNPEDALRRMVSKMEPLARRKGQSIVFEEEPEAQGATLLADPSMFDMTFSNLLDNAIKYTGEGGTIKVRAKPQDRGILFSVEDNGPGISQEDLPRVFERFYRSAKDRSRLTGGSGLGLAIVKHCVAAHGGKVWVSSREGHGTTFFVWLPKGSQAEAEAQSR